MLNAIVDKKTKSTEEEGEKMELDESEKAASEDHAKAVAQMDGTAGKVPFRRRRGKAGASGDMDTTENARNEAGKRDATVAGTEPPPAPKCLQLPPAAQQFDIAKDDGVTKVGAKGSAAEEAAAKEEAARKALEQAANKPAGGN